MKVSVFMLISVVFLMVGASSFAANNFGALAYGTQSKSYGWSVDYSSKAGAAQRALSECGSDDCKVVLEFWNTCAAYALSNSAYGWSIGATSAEAKRKALAYCNANSDANDCRIKVWGCNSP